MHYLSFATCLLENFWHHILTKKTNLGIPLGAEKAARRGAAMAAGEVEDFGGARDPIELLIGATPSLRVTRTKEDVIMLISFGAM